MLRRALKQLADPMLMLLAAAAALTIWQGDVADTAVIALVIVLNTAVGVAQELRAERAVAALRQMAAPTGPGGARRVVDHRWPRPTSSVATCWSSKPATWCPPTRELVESHQLTADESAVTGESLGVAKRAGDSVLAGTTLTRGRGRAVSPPRAPTALSAASPRWWRRRGRDRRRCSGDSLTSGVSSRRRPWLPPASSWP